jgi:16S rRNA (uracil1498-N3)-methyltransferase
MPARRFFVEGVRSTGESVAIAGSDAHKIARVLRLRDGDAIEIVDSAGATFAAALTIAGTTVHATLGEKSASANRVAGFEVAVAQALPKRQKMDFVVEKTTELGAHAILPFCCERTIAREASGAKLARWRRLAKAAAQQSGRPDVPAVDDVSSFEALLDRFSEFDVVLFAWELAAHEPLRERLPPLLAGARRVLIAIGPEGGFTHAEADAARARGAAAVWLGERILRTETAALALLAIVGVFAPPAAEADSPPGPELRARPS